MNARRLLGSVVLVAVVAAGLGAGPTTDRASAAERPPGTAPAPSDLAHTAATQTVPGIDVASWQHPGGAPIDWPRVYGAGHRYAFIKAAEGPIGCTGNYYVNPWYSSDWAGAGAAGLYRGAYHFAQPLRPVQQTAIDQARFFVGVTGPMTGARDLVPVLDLEVTCGLAPHEVAQWAHTWLGEVERLTGRKAAITTYPSFWSGPMANNTTFGAYPLWIARYGTPSPFPLLAGWRDWTWWQTGQGSVPGIVGPVDLNLFNGDLAWLDRYAWKASPYPASPIGKLERVQVAGMRDLVVHGWAIDADTRDPIDVTITVDGAPTRVRADLYRHDIGAFFWLWGPFHGFAPRITGVGPGQHTVCARAHNVDAGTDTFLGCQQVTMPTGPPIGALEQMAWRPAGWQIDGWALDPDTADPVDVSLTVDGSVVRTVRADRSRPEVGAFFPDWGPDHGFSFRHWPPPGTHELCLVAHNIGPGQDRVLGCRQVSTPGPNPIGGLLLAQSGGGQFRIAGWTLDPDTAASLSVSITIDGAVATTRLADIDIPVLGFFFAGFGSRHGFDLTVPLAPGNHWVCVVAHNLGAGSDTTLGCGAHAG